MVVSTSKALRQWSAVSDRRDLDVDLTDCLDKAAGVGLGISLAKPGSKVLVLDTDATLRTNPNAMVTTAAVAPDNLVHFPLKTATMSPPEAHPYLGGDMDFTSLARDSGYASVHRFDKPGRLGSIPGGHNGQKRSSICCYQGLSRLRRTALFSRTLAESLSDVREALSAL